jgi:PII-like signaling protein
VRQVQSGKILRIHISESDRWQGKPLYEAIVAKCRELKMAGATVLAGLEGFGATAEMRKAHLLRNDRPILVMVVDTAENIDRLVPVVAEMMDTGLLAASNVETIRVENL